MISLWFWFWLGHVLDMGDLPYLTAVWWSVPFLVSATFSLFAELTFYIFALNEL